MRLNGKILQLLALATLTFLLVYQIRSCRTKNQTISRLQYNQEALTESIQRYQTESNLQAYYVKQLTQTKSELKETNAQLAQQLKDAKIKLRDLQSATDIAQTAQYVFVPETIMRIDTLTLSRSPALHYSDGWLTFDMDTAVRIETHDSILVAMHCRTRRFLFWTWRRYSGQTTVINRNPHVRIDNIQTTNLEK